MKQFICIVCPRGCRISVDDNNIVTGAFCPRGKNYVLKEMSAPERNLSSSIRVSNRPYTLVSVKTSSPVPKDKIFDVMNEINQISVKAPISIGQIVKKDLLGLNIDLVVTKKID